jgi:hypothetical protein
MPRQFDVRYEGDLPAAPTQATVREALGDTNATVGDPVNLAVAGLDPMDGVLDHLSASVEHEKTERAW